MKVFVTTLTIFLSLSFSSRAEEETSDLVQMLKDAKVAPYKKGGKVVGIKAAEIKNGSKWEKLGMKKGDIVKTVNGQRVGSPQEAMNLYSELKEREKSQVETENN